MRMLKMFTCIDVLSPQVGQILTPSLSRTSSQVCQVLESANPFSLLCIQSCPRHFYVPIIDGSTIMRPCEASGSFTEYPLAMELIDSYNRLGYLRVSRSWMMKGQVKLPRSQSPSVYDARASAAMLQILMVLLHFRIEMYHLESDYLATERSSYSQEKGQLQTI